MLGLGSNDSLRGIFAPVFQDRYALSDSQLSLIVTISYVGNLLFLSLGGKLLGAGGGGFLLVYCPYNVKHQVARRLENAGGQLMDWNFELRGAQSWICDEDRWDYHEVEVKMPDKEYCFHV